MRATGRKSGALGVSRWTSGRAAAGRRTPQASCASRHGAPSSPHHDTRPEGTWRGTNVSRKGVCGGSLKLPAFCVTVRRSVNLRSRPLGVDAGGHKCQRGPHGTAQGRETPESGAGDTRNVFRVSLLRIRRRFAGASHAGGGTRTPDTRIMIPLLLGSTEPRGAGGHKRGHNRAASRDF